MRINSRKSRMYQCMDSSRRATLRGHAAEAPAGDHGIAGPSAQTTPGSIINFFCQGPFPVWKYVNRTMAGCRSGDEFLARPCEWLPKPRRESRSLTIVSSGTYPRLVLVSNSPQRLHSRTGSSWHSKRRERSAFAGSLGARTLKSGLSFKECRSVTRPEPDRRASEIRFGS
jgi:hypothetical protein